MRRSLVYTMVMYAIVTNVPLQAQSTLPDPFDGSHQFRRKMQIVSVREGTNPTQDIYNYVNIPSGPDSVIAGLPFTHPDGSSYGKYSIAAGNFCGDRLDEFVVAWNKVDGSLRVAVMRAAEASHTQSVVWEFTSPPGTVFELKNNSYTLCSRVVVQVGQFDDDAQQEFVVAFTASDSTVHIRLYDTDDGTTFHEKASIAEQRLFLKVPWNEYGYDARANLIDLAVADLDADGISEVLLGCVEPDVSNMWDIALKLYDYDPTGTLFTPATKRVLHSRSSSPTHTPFHIAVMAGEFTSVAGVECYAWWSVADTTVASARLDRHMMFRCDKNLAGFTAGTMQPAIRNPILANGDLDADGLAEVIISDRDSIRVYTVDTTLALKRICFLRPTIKAGEIVSYFNYGPARMLVVADVNSDSTTNWQPELVVHESGWRTSPPYTVYRLRFFEPVRDAISGKLTGLTSVYEYPLSESAKNPVASVAASFDRDDIRLGTPLVFSKTAIIQPLVILNAPPVHYDVLSGTSYDVCKAFGSTPCSFVSTYEKQSGSTLEVETEISKTWNTTFTGSAGISYLGASIGMNIEERFGAHFSKQTGSSNTIRIGVSIDALADDMIYATVARYDIWEYPAFMGDEEIGAVLVVDPNSATIQHGWFATKDWNASTYVPDHEVGNILSYRRYSDLLENPNLRTLIKGSNTVFFSLNATSSPKWYLTFADFTSSGTTTSSTHNMQIGGSMSVVGNIFGISAGVKRDYSSEEVYTHRTSVMSDLSLKMQLGGVDEAIGEVAYQVTPYTYWAKNGALVLDYAVQPALAEPGYTPTWWQVRYNKPDPAFILPWRYDPEKGKTLEDPAKRYQMKDISFYPPDPVHGDTVQLVARVRNFGLLNTNVPVKVRFYLGDPASGGTPIVGTMGEMDIVTDGIVPARETKRVSLTWQIPLNTPQLPRIYVVINPDTVMDEVHTNNNKGFAVLSLTSLPTAVEAETSVPREMVLEQNYPNPFNPFTIIDYRLSIGGTVKISVTDLLGREVAVLVDEERPPGRYQVSWDAAGMASGVYFCRLQAGGEVMIRKMVLMR